MCSCRIGSIDYIAQRGEQPGHFFHFSDHNPQTKAHFTTKVCDTLASVGVDCTSNSGRSFRIGVATTVALAGVADSVIKALGRWSRAAFLGYIALAIRWGHQYARKLCYSLLKVSIGLCMFQHSLELVLNRDLDKR